jgi:hypothetical protein
MRPGCKPGLSIFKKGFFQVDRQQWVRYINRHIPLNRDLPCLTEEELERWGRLCLLVPPDKQYHHTDLERTLALLMLERAVIAKVKAGSA